MGVSFAKKARHAMLAAITPLHMLLLQQARRSLLALPKHYTRRSTLDQTPHTTLNTQMYSQLVSAKYQIHTSYTKMILNYKHSTGITVYVINCASKQPREKCSTAYSCNTSRCCHRLDMTTQVNVTGLDMMLQHVISCYLGGQVLPYSQRKASRPCDKSNRVESIE